MKKILYTAFIAGLFLAYSCDDNPTQSEAKPATLLEISEKPGFNWFYEEIEKYDPDQAIVAQIEANYDSESEEIFMYVNPSCTCPGNHTYFPKLVKVLQEAGISESQFKLYTMTSEKNQHPMSEMYKINDLPSFAVFRDGMPVYSINDTIAADVLADKVRTIEEYLLTAISN